MFLVYAGVFRDFSDPVAVARYYFECLKNREGFLTYKISKKGFFNQDRLGELYKKYKMNSIDVIHLKLNELNSESAIVQAKIIYKDRNEKIINLVLEKKEKIWEISSALE